MAETQAEPTASATEHPEEDEEGEEEEIRVNEVGAPLPSLEEEEDEEGEDEEIDTIEIESYIQKSEEVDEDIEEDDTGSLIIKKSQETGGEGEVAEWRLHYYGEHMGEWGGEGEGQVQQDEGGEEEEDEETALRQSVKEEGRKLLEKIESSRLLFDPELQLDDFPPNCFVDFDGVCVECPIDTPPLSPSLLDMAAEVCGENDEECLQRLAKAKSMMEAGARLSEGTLRRMKALKNRTLTTKSGNLFPGVMPDTLFEGLPDDYYKKKYKPDYPDELKMRIECKRKPFRKKGTGTSKTHPKAIFTPAESALIMTKSLIDPAIAAILDEPSPLELNRMPPPILSSSDELIVDWLMDHNIQMMFEYFLGLCVVHKPEDPWQFISQLCIKMIEARTNIETFDALPRLLAPEHTEAIFRIFDRVENGYINVSQYKAAMEAMGLSEYSQTPEGAEKNQVSKDTFVKEATDAINNVMQSFLKFEEDESEEMKVKKSTSSGADKVLSEETGSGSYSSSGEYTEDGEVEGEYYEEEEGEGKEIDDSRRQSMAPIASQDEERQRKSLMFGIPDTEEDEDEEEEDDEEEDEEGENELEAEVYEEEEEASEVNEANEISVA